jgi:2',3'-cyclic-nucleotide 2'-phosphodiesterase
MRILFVGDILGKPGRQVTAEWLPQLRKEHDIDLVIVNAENAAGGNGITEPVIDMLYNIGVDAITTGNHAWDKREGHGLIEDGRVLRPANYPADAGGIGATVVHTSEGYPVGVLNLQGRTFMQPIDCPFRVARRQIEDLRSEAIVIIVDFHAEATSEKQAMGWYLDGDVTAVLGTHTHVPTADERVLPEGTAYITDVGMTGPYESILGMEIEGSLNRFLTGRRDRMVPARNDVRFSAVLIDVDPQTGHALSIQRISKNEGSSRSRS